MIYSGSVNEAVAFVVALARRVPVSVIVEPFFDGGRMAAFDGNAYVSREVFDRLTELSAPLDPRPVPIGAWAEMERARGPFGTGPAEPMVSADADSDR